MTLRLLCLSLPIASLLFASACDLGPIDLPPDDSDERHPLGKADNIGSCQIGENNACGGPSLGNCWCDELCVEIGDCCTDYDAICVAEPLCPDPADPNVDYVSDDPELCTLIDFLCEPGQEQFVNACGCGCIGNEECHDPTDPGVEYNSFAPQVCAVALFACEPGMVPFYDPCGCGCVVEESSCPAPDAPDNPYLIQDPEKCELAKFSPGGASSKFGCAEGYSYFADECGCGCAPDPVCPDPAATHVNYISQDPEQCALVQFVCAEGMQPFNDACGCGCIGEPAPACPEAEVPGVKYVGDSPEQCAAILFQCIPGMTPFFSECGCGCVPA